MIRSPAGGGDLPIPIAHDDDLQAAHAEHGTHFQRAARAGLKAVGQLRASYSSRDKESIAPLRLVRQVRVCMRKLGRDGYANVA